MNPVHVSFVAMAALHEGQQPITYASGERGHVLCQPGALKPIAYMVESSPDAVERMRYARSLLQLRASARRLGINGSESRNDG